VSDLADLQKRITAMEDIHAIKQLRHKYWYTFDHRMWDGFAECFTEGLVFEVTGRFKYEGRDKFIKFVSERALGRKSVHQGHNPLIELTSDTTAKGRWPLNDLNIDTRDGSESTGYGYYEDEYVKEQGAWKIRAVKLTYLLRIDRTTKHGS